ncbi:MAG: hypothetical protein QXX83_08785 [Thermofilum sp.]
MPARHRRIPPSRAVSIALRTMVRAAKAFFHQSYIYQRIAMLIQLSFILVIGVISIYHLYRSVDPLYLEIGLSAMAASPLILIYMAPHANLFNFSLYIASSLASYYAGLTQSLPVHGFAIAASLAAISPRLRFTLDSPVVERAIARGFSILRSSIRRSAIPLTLSELRARLLDNILTVASFIVSFVAFMATRNPVMSLSLILSMLLLFVLVFGIFMSPAQIDVRFISGKGIFRIYRNFARYRGLRSLAERVGRTIADDLERAGMSVDPMLYAAKYLSYSLILLSISPSIYTAMVILMPQAPYIALAALAAPAIPFLAMRLAIQMAISSRKARLEKAYPFFTVLSAVAIINGVRDIEKIFEMFISGSRASELLPQMSTEASILLRYIRIMGLTPVQAIDRYISYCPSESFRSYMRGYVNQLAIGTPLKDFAVRMVMEALELMKRRLEGLGAILNTMLTIFITALSFPVLPLIMGVLLNPESVVPMIIAMMLMGGPLAYILFNMAASKISVSFPNKLPRMKLFYPSAGLIIGTALALALIYYLGQPVSIASTVLFISFLAGLAIDFRNAYREAAEVERNIVVFLNSIADLVEVRSVGKALEYLIVETRRAGGSRFGRSFMEIIERMASYLQKGDPLAKASWFSGSWLMRFVQVVLSQVETAGQRSKEVIKMLGWFFSDYIVIVRTTRSRLFMAVGIMMMVPAVLVIVLSAAMGIVSSASSVVAKANIDVEALLSQARNIPVPKSVLSLVTGKGIDTSVAGLVDFLIVEIGIVLSLAASKSIYGTLRAARIPLIMSIFILALLLMKPLFIQMMIIPMK